MTPTPVNARKPSAFWTRSRLIPACTRHCKCWRSAMTTSSFALNPSVTWPAHHTSTDFEKLDDDLDDEEAFTTRGAGSGRESGRSRAEHKPATLPFRQ